jgi:seryl-tRNA synthetase
LPNLPADIVPVGKTPEENLNVLKKEKFQFCMKARNHIGISKIRHHRFLGVKITGAGFQYIKEKEHGYNAP